VARKSAQPLSQVSPELLGLLRTCKEAPDDDAPLLVLADWLEERNGPTDADRAALIRAQCELARPEDVSPRRRELHDEEERLRLLHRQEWIGPLRDHASIHRGLLHLRPAASTLLSAKAVRWLESEAGAWAEALQLNAFSGRSIGALAAQPFLAHLSQLEFLFDGRQPIDLRELLASPHLVNLRVLSVQCLKLTDADAGAAAVAAWPHLAGLDTLMLRVGISDAGAAALAASPAARGLRRLGLSDNKITGVGAAALAASPSLAGLRVLGLTGNAIGDAGALALAASPHLSGLEKLALKGRGLGPAAVDALRQRFGARLDLTDW
jgi:uncharacterized protein (TIGR02996 family)